MNYEKSLKIKRRYQPSRCRIENSSDTSFLSENFCINLLGEPFDFLRNKKVVNSSGNLSKSAVENDRNFRKQRVAVYNLVEELDFKQPNISQQTIKDQLSKRSLRKQMSSDEIRKSNIENVISTFSQSEAKKEPSEENRSQKSSRSGPSPRASVEQNQSGKQSILSSSAPRKLSSSENDENQEISLRNNNNSELIQEASVISNHGSSGRFIKLKNKEYENSENMYVRSNSVISEDKETEDIEDNRNLQKKNPFFFKELSHSSKSKSQSIHGAEERDDLQKPYCRCYLLEEGENVNYINNNKNQTHEKGHPNIREYCKINPRPCYCDINSQTSYPSILKQPLPRSISSNIDNYPVKEASWRQPKQPQKFADKMLQTSDNSMLGFKFSNDSQILTTDPNIKALANELAGVQVTEFDSTHVQTTESSSTAEEIIFRSCRCNEHSPNRKGYHEKKLSSPQGQSRNYLRKESIVTSPPERPSRTVERYSSEAIVCLPKSRVRGSTCFNETSPNHKTYRLSNSPPERYSQVSNRSQKTLERYPSEQRPSLKLRGIFTEASEDDASNYEYPIQDGDKYDTYEVQKRFDYPCENYQPRYEKESRDRSRFNRRDTCYINNKERKFCCCGKCGRCARRFMSPSSISKRQSQKPTPPPIDYELSSSDDDRWEIFQNEQESDEYYLSDQSDHKLTSYQDLPYQGNEQYVDLVQELEETLQSRNKNRVQRALREFEHRSRHNEPLEKPIIDYEEPSESEDAIIKRISELTEKRIKYHKAFPCKGKACCNCIVKRDRNEEQTKLQSPKEKPTLQPKKKSQWQMNTSTGEWYKVPSDFSQHRNNNNNNNRMLISSRKPECECTCTCTK